MKRRYRDKKSRHYIMRPLIKNGCARCPICNKKLEKFVYDRCSNNYPELYYLKDGYICTNKCFDIEFDSNKFVYAEIYWGDRSKTCIIDANNTNNCIDVSTYRSDSNFKKHVVISVAIGSSIKSILKWFEDNYETYKLLS